jgi:hypothetical protein
MSEEKTKAVTVVHGNSMMTDTARFEHSYRVAKVFAGSQLIPKHLQGKIEDIMIALNIADRLNEDALTVMQSIYIVSGKAGWSASYMIARINQSGLIKGRITWDIEGSGKDLKVTAKATLSDTGEVVTAPVSMQMAMAEGWTSNKKYSSMPEIMLRYRSAAMLQRMYFPEVMLGMRTAEELEDTQADPPVRDITPPKTAAAALEAFAGTTTGPSGRLMDLPPAEPVVANDVPPDGPNVFDAGDEEKVAELERRTGLKREPVENHDPETGEVIDDADQGEAFDPVDYLASAIKTLQTLKIDEIAGANDEVKRTLVKYPDQIGQWQAARFARLAELSDPAKRGRR